MTTFEVRVTTLPGEGESFMDYASLALVMLGGRSVNGMNFDEMAKRLDLRKKFKDAKPGGTITLEDDELETLKSIMPTMRWTVIDEQIVEFGRYLSSLQPTAPVSEPTAEETV